MTKEQYKRANQRTFLVNMIIIVGFFGLTGIGGSIEGFSVVLALGILVNLIGAGITIYGFVRFREEKTGGILVISGSVLIFSYVIIADKVLMFYALGLPILLSCILYKDIKLLLLGETVLTAASFICLAMMIVQTHSFPQDGFFVIFVYALADVAAVECVKLLRAFTNENDEIIRAGMDEQKRAYQEMSEIAGNISDLFEQSRENMEDLRKIIDSTNNGMQDIANGADDTAHAIQEQSEKCQEIQIQTKDADGQREQMMEVSKITQEAVKDGEHVIGELKLKNENVVLASQTTIESTRAVTKKVEEIQDIVGIIMSISSQTNLLSLNASIEAARAGEAGRGFAVVAEEIRQLSEQTNEASGQITSIIGELTADAERSMKSIDETANTVDAQNRMIGETEEKFQIINNNVVALIERFENIGESLKIIVKSTAEMNDGISDLSAVSEEIAASSSEGVHLSNTAVERFNEFDQVLQGIYREAKKLDSMGQ